MVAEVEVEARWSSSKLRIDRRALIPVNEAHAVTQERNIGM